MLARYVVPLLILLTSVAAGSPAKGADLIIEQAALMRPGEWRNIAHLTSWPGKDDGVGFKSFQYVRPIDGGEGGADGMGWTQTLVHHRGRLMMVLSRSQYQRALMIMEPDGHFWRIDQPVGFDSNANHPGGRRPFNRLTQDAQYLYFAPADMPPTEMGWFIRTPLESPGDFERFGVPIGDSQMDGVGNFAVTYVPEWTRFYAYTPGGKIWSWAEGESEWLYHGRLPSDPADENRRLSGYAGLLLWNSVKNELAIVGGQTFGNRPRTSYKSYRLTDPLGSPELLPDRTNAEGERMPWSSGGSKLIVDPRDGSYLFLRSNVLYRSCTLGGHYHLFEDLRDAQPFGAYEPYAPYTHLPDSEVIVFLSHIRGLILYRLRELTPDEHCQQHEVMADATTRQPSKQTNDHLRGSVIAELAARLAPGTHAALEDTTHPPGHASFRDWFLNNGRHDTWGDAVYWDPSSARVYFQGLETQGDTFIAYDAHDNSWVELPLSGGPRRETAGYHVYNKGTLDPVSGRYYRLWRRGRDNPDGVPFGSNTLLGYSISERKWNVVVKAMPIQPVSGGAESSYVPLEWHGGLRQLVLIRGRRAWAFDPDNGRLDQLSGYTDLGPISVHGYHSTSHFNITRGDMLVLGGNYSKRSAAVISGTGQINSVADLPFDHGVANDNLTHDPVSGNYLVYRARSHELWELSPSLNEWVLVARFVNDPWRGHYAGLRLAPIPELGVIFIQTEHGARLYKHRSAVTETALTHRQPSRSTRPPVRREPVIPAPPVTATMQESLPEEASGEVRAEPAPDARNLSSAMIRAIRGEQ